MNKRYAIYWISNYTRAKGNGSFVFKTRKSAVDYINSTVSKEYQYPYFTYRFVSN